MSIPLIDYILNLFRDPEVGAQFVANPNQALCEAGLAGVSESQLQSVALAAAPASLALGDGDPVVGLQRAVASSHNIASPFSPTTVYAPSPTYAPETNTAIASHNDTNVEVASPDQVSGANSQSGGFNFAMGDVTFGDKTTTTQTASDGAVIVDGENDGDIQTVNDVETGDHSPVVVGDDNELDDDSTTVTTVAGGDVIQGNDGPVINEVDMSGGDGGDADSGDSLIGIGTGGNEGGDGGDAGSIVIVESDDDVTTNTQTVDIEQAPPAFPVIEPDPEPIVFAEPTPELVVVQEIDVVQAPVAEPLIGA